MSFAVLICVDLAISLFSARVDLRVKCQRLAITVLLVRNDAF